MNPKFLYLNSGHREMLSVLTSAIGDRRGLITIVGDVGTGKTTLLKTLLGKFNEKTKVAYIFNTTVTFEEMLAMALVDLGIPEPDKRLCKVEALHRLNDFAKQQVARGGNVVLMVDEAQNLDSFAMENLQLLSNQESHKHKPIQVVLCGLPELEDKLKQPEVQLLDDLVSINRIAPLNESETYDYIQHRLEVADYTGPALFTRRAQRLVWEYSKGVPREINTICDNALLTGYALGKTKIKASVVEKAVENLRWRFSSMAPHSEATSAVEECSPQLKSSISHTRFALAASLLLAVCTFSAIGLLVTDYSLKVKSAGPLQGDETVPVGSPSQANGSNESWAAGLRGSHQQTSMARLVALARISKEKIKFDIGAVGPRSYDHQSSSGVFSETKKAESSLSTETASGGRDEAPGRNARHVSSQKREEIRFVLSIIPQQKPDEKATCPAAAVPNLKKDAAEVANVVIQVGSFRERVTAERLVKLLQEEGYDAYLEIRTLKNLGLFHRVRLRGYATVAAAMTEMPRLKKQEFNDAFILSPQPQS